MRQKEEKAGIFTVGQILDEEFRDNDHTGEPNIYYLVHWKYFPKSQDSWEPQQNLIGGEDALKRWAEKKLSNPKGALPLIDWLIDLLNEWEHLHGDLINRSC